MAHTTVSSIYSAAEDVPLILAPQFSALQPVTLPYDFNLDLPQVENHDFQLERHIIAESEKYRQNNATIEQIRAQKLQAFQEERIRKQKEEARKIAPGFLDTDLRILTPVPANTQRRASQQVESGNNIAAVSENGMDKQKHVRSASDDMSLHVLEKMKKSKEEGDEAKPAKSFYSEFEESLPPQNPWEQPQDDISILREVIGPPISSNKVDNFVNGAPNFLGAPANHDKMVTNPNPPRSFHPSPLLQPSIGAPLPSQLSSQTFALGSLTTHSNSDHHLSNNFSSLQISQNSYSTSPINNTISSVKSYSAPSSSQERRPLHQPYSTPPIPPKEVLLSISPKNEKSDDENSNLIKKFTNMGFTKEQATVALEKYDYDLNKATNYLLDLQ